MGKTIYDLLDSIFKRHGLPALMLVAVSFMYWDSRTYERNADKEMEKTVKSIQTELSMVNYKVSDIDKSIDQLEKKVFFSIDTDGDGRDDDEHWVIIDYKEENNGISN